MLATPGEVADLYPRKENTVTFDTDTYLVTNVGSGENIYFERDGTVGTKIGSSTVGVNLEAVTYADVSGESVTGMVISGTTSATLKCLAAQYALCSMSSSHGGA